MTVARWLFRALVCTLLTGAVTAALASPARAAFINPGQAAPAFTKNVLGSTPWPTATLSQFAGKVLILHIIGYN